MKKLIFMFVTMLALSFVSCGNKTSQNTGIDSIDTVNIDTVDSAAVDSTVNE